MDPYNPEEFFRLPNNNAYAIAEVREGPPLSYVAENFRRNLESLHSLINEIDCMVDESVNTPSEDSANSIEEGQLIHHARCAFKCGLVGYLALHNMLAVASEYDLDGRLLGYSRDELGEWLDRIDKAGSVTG